MFSRRQPYLGVDLRTNSIILVQAGRTQYGYTVARWTDVHLPPNAYREGQILIPEAVGKALRAALREHFRRWPRQAAVVVGGQNCLVKRISLPRLSERRLRSLLESEGEQWMPFLREGGAFDYKVLGPGPTDQEQDVALAAVPQRFITLVQATLRAAGLRLAALDLDAAALYRAASVTQPPPAEGLVATLDSQRLTPRLCLLDRGVPVAVRNLDAGPIGPMENPASRERLEALVLEVRRALDLLLTQNRGTGLARLIVNGWVQSPAELQGELDRELRSELAQRLLPEFTVVSALAEELPPRSAVGLGLALLSVRPPARLELLPRASARQQRAQALSLLLSLAIAGGTAGYGALLHRSELEIKARRQQVERSLKGLAPVLQQEPAIAAEEKETEALKPLVAAWNSAPPLSAALPALNELLPVGVRLTQVVVQPPMVMVTGVATRPEQVAQLLEALATAPGFRRPVLAHSETAGAEISFSLSAELLPREVSKR